MSGELWKHNSPLTIYYADAFFNLINWQEVEQRFLADRKEAAMI